jgi:hypothetical protein
LSHCEHLRAAISLVIAEEDVMPGASSEISRKAFEVAPEAKELFESVTME